MSKENRDIAELLERGEAQAKVQFEAYKKSSGQQDVERDVAMGIARPVRQQDPVPRLSSMYDPEPRMADPEPIPRPRSSRMDDPEPVPARMSGVEPRRRPARDMDPEPRPYSARDIDPEHDPLRLTRPSMVTGATGKNRYKDDGDESDERPSRRSRDRGDDDAANGASDKDSANGSGRHGGRRTRSRSPASRPDSRGSMVRTRTPPGGGDHYNGGGRRAYDDGWRPDSRGGSSRHGDYESGRRGGRYEDDRRGREDRRREPPHHGGRKRKTPEPTDDERDRRTVFVQQLAARLRTKHLREFFEQAGPVVEGQIVKDRVSGRSKGVGYVEFKDEESVEKAIALTGQKLLGIPVIVQLTEAEKNRIAKTEGGATQSNGIPFHRLYVGNIHFSITEDDLKNVFEPFGELEFVQLQKEEHGRSKGYGFVQFIDPGQAKEALEKMNGFELAGRPIRVGLGNDKFTPESTQSLLQRFGKPAQGQGSSFSGMGGRGAHAGGSGNFDRSAGRDADKTGGASALDDTDVGGVNFSNYSRDALMRKLARIDEPEQKTAPKSHQQRKTAVIEPNPSRCIIIKNAYDAATETDPNWKEDLKLDVKTECDKQYGKVVHLELALDNDDGEVYVKFAEVEGGKNAILGLNGRYFGNRQITAQYVVDAVYNSAFPKAQKV